LLRCELQGSWFPIRLSADRGSASCRTRLPEPLAKTSFVTGLRRSCQHPIRFPNLLLSRFLGEGTGQRRCPTKRHLDLIPALAAPFLRWVGQASRSRFGNPRYDSRRRVTAAAPRRPRHDEGATMRACYDALQGDSRDGMAAKLPVAFRFRRLRRHVFARGCLGALLR
jgi:hypothetical protein